MQADIPTQTEWVVVQSTDSSVSALNLGEAYERGGFWVVEGVTTYPDGIRETAWTTPAYREERLRFDCPNRRYHLFASALMRGNADSVHSTWPSDTPFSPVGADTLRAAQWAAVCQGIDQARTRTFNSRFSFMDSYARR